MPTIQTITSGATVKVTQNQGILSNTTILVTQTKTLSSDTKVRMPFIVLASVQVTKPESDEKLAQTDVSNPVPSAPTGLVAADAGLGDVVNLNWTSSASRFNVYRKDPGPVYVKLNPNVLEGVLSFSAGGLTPDVAAIFVVRALNGISQESPNSNEATAIPTLNINLQRFTTPTYQVTISSILRTDAILSTVQLGFGSNFSTATFTLPVDPRGIGQPDLDAPVDITINGKLVFRGIITTRGDAIDEGAGLRIQYNCHSTLINLTKTTKFSTDVDNTNTMFNVLIHQADGKAIIRNAKTAAQILSILGITNGPSDFPGEVNITDLTPLSAAEVVLSHIGNYRLYHDMVTSETSVYNFGSNGFSVREFQFGKNIISFDIQKSDLDIVRQIKVIGAPTRIRTRALVSDISVAIDSDGKLAASFQVSGKNIRDIQVLGWQNEKPTAFFDESIQVTLADFESSGFVNLDTFQLQSVTPLSFTPITLDGFSSGSITGGTSQNDSNKKDMYPAVTHIEHHSSQRQGIGAKIDYRGNDSAKVFLSEVPKQWFSVTRSGNVSRNVVQGLQGGGTFNVTVLLGYDFRVGQVEVEFTIDADPTIVTAGSGTPSKTITDSQYEIVQDSISGFNNTTDITNRMTVRANGELARLNKLNTGGTITIVGDETVDLRSSVRVEGELLEISGITHSFTNGFTTSVSVINEPFFRTIIVPPNIQLESALPTKKEERSRRLFEAFQTTQLAEIHKELASQKDKTDKHAPSSGQFANAQ